MKSLTKKPARFCVFIMFSILLPVLDIKAESDPVVIGYSNHPEATAYNNARKIVRTSDDIRLVVFQDSVGQNPVVMWTYSSDGVLWSEPEQLGKGEFPALAIDSTDHVFAAWTRQDSSFLNFASFEKDVSSSRKVILTNWVTENLAVWNLPAKHISIEASSVGLHVVGERDDQLFYSVYDKKTFGWLYSLPVDQVYRDFQLDRTNYTTRFPSITGDLGFVPGLLHILWTDYSNTLNDAEIGYLRIPEDNHDYMKIEFPPNLKGKSFPSISVRNRDESASSVIMAYFDSAQKLLFTSAGFSWIEDSYNLYSDSLTVSDNPMPSVDDVLPFAMSCAIVWQNGGEILYGQFEDQTIITQPPILVSEANGFPKKYPSVCYRTFRGDVFDAVWTEGSQAPYKVMYRRMPKCYSAEKVKIITRKLTDAVVGIRYFDYIDVAGGSGSYYIEVVSGTFPAFLCFCSHTELWGDPPVSTGVFHFTIKATDYAESSSDTASYTLVVKDYQFSLDSPDSVTAEKGDTFNYSASILDPWNRPVSCLFQNLPSWLSASDSTLGGTVPLNAVDTCFQVIATKNERSDTFTVTIHIQETNGVISDRFAESPETFALFPNYPNPFNPTTTIRFGLPESRLVLMDLLDLNGKLVKNILKQSMPKGFHSVVLDGADLTSGVYVIRMRSGNFMKITKCVLLK